jgi:hypothetical protein
MNSIKIADEYTRHPGPRFRDEGAHSGEEFREKYLLPKFLEARASGQKLMIDLDGVEFGYPASFLEEAFGGLARDEGINEVNETLVFRSIDEPSLERKIRNFIHDCENIKPRRRQPA